MNKKQTRVRRSKRSRAKIRELAVPRLSVHKTLNHIYAQIIAPCGATVIASASTLEKALRSKLKCGGNKEAAVEIGRLIAERGIDVGVKSLAFDRSGFQYHGRIRALADAAREAGLAF